MSDDRTYEKIKIEQVNTLDPYYLESNNHFELTDIDLYECNDNNNNGFSTEKKTPRNAGIKNIRSYTILLVLDEHLIWLKSLPSHYVIISFLLGVAVIASGAIIFLVLIGATPYNSADTNANLVEISSQILNAIFTIICTTIFSLKAVSFYQYCSLYLCSLDNHANTSQNLIQSFPWVAKTSSSNEIDTKKINSLGILLSVQIMHCLCQGVVAFFMWTYAARTRPAASMMFVALAITLGCGAGIFNRHLAIKFKV